MTAVYIAVAVFVIIFILSYFLISRIPQLLHTPLMSMTNAISAVIILGALLLFTNKNSAFDIILGSIAIIAASFNVVGGFVITDRMVKLF